MSDKTDVNNNKNRWPTKAVMRQIYEESFWGGKELDFYSGDGSHKPEIIDPYVNVLKKFFQTFEHPISVCDLGCGDFNVGRQLVASTQKYIAIDIVETLVARNKTLFLNEKLQFLCLDIAKDALPQADVAIVRQVLQHLSNTEILEIIPRLNQYQFILITEHLPLASFESNLDMITGQGNRLKIKSGVVLTDAPFYLSPIKQEVLLELPVDAKSCIKTILYQNY